MMHTAEQHAALRQRAARLRADGLLVLQYHALSAILRLQQWNAIRLGHIAYYSTPALVGMLTRVGLAPLAAHESSLYGGTVTLMADEDALGCGKHTRLAKLQNAAHAGTQRLAADLEAARTRGERVVGYGAASRAHSSVVEHSVRRFWCGAELWGRSVSDYAAAESPPHRMVVAS
jgi:hypothetical protein